MTDYKLVNGPMGRQSLLRLSDNASIPIADRNSDYQRYLVDIAQGGTLFQADLPTAEELAQVQEQTDKQTLLTELSTLLPVSYTLTDLSSDLNNLKTYYQLAGPTAAQTQTSYKVSLRVLGFAIQWLARRTPR